MIRELFYRLTKEYRNENKKNLWGHVLANFFYGIIHVTLIMFVTSGNPGLLATGYLIFYIYLSTIVNRDKYTTSLGKFIVFPFPATAGAVLGYYITQIFL